MLEESQLCGVPVRPWRLWWCHQDWLQRSDWDAEISVSGERSYVRSGFFPLQQSMQSMCTKRMQYSWVVDAALRRCQLLLSLLDVAPHGCQLPFCSLLQQSQLAQEKSTHKGGFLQLKRKAPPISLGSSPALSLCPIP